MFCPNCGTNLPDDALFCASCGNRVAETLAAPAQEAPAALAQEVPVAPAYVETPVAPVIPALSAKMRGVKKRDFLKNEDSPKVKIASKLSYVFLAVIAVLIVAATVLVNTVSVFDLPIVAMTVDEEDRKEAKKELKDSVEAVDEIDERMEELEERFDKKEIAKLKKVVKQLKTTSRDLSITNLKGLVDVTRDFYESVDDELAEEADLPDDFDETMEEFEEIVQIFDVIIAVTIAIAGINLLLVLLAAVFKQTWISVLVIIFYVPVCMLLSSTAVGLGLLAALVALAVTTSMVNRAYKRA